MDFEAWCKENGEYNPAPKERCDIGPITIDRDGSLHSYDSRSGAEIVSDGGRVRIEDGELKLDSQITIRKV